MASCGESFGRVTANTPTRYPPTSIARIGLSRMRLGCICEKNSRICSFVTCVAGAVFGGTTVWAAAVPHNKNPVTAITAGRFIHSMAGSIRRRHDIWRGCYTTRRFDESLETRATGARSRERCVTARGRRCEADYRGTATGVAAAGAVVQGQYPHAHAEQRRRLDSG